jgi:hypothetical protein
VRTFFIALLFLSYEKWWHNRMVMLSVFAKSRQKELESNGGYQIVYHSTAFKLDGQFWMEKQRTLLLDRRLEEVMRILLLSYFLNHKFSHVLSEMKFQIILLFLKFTWHLPHG